MDSYDINRSTTPSMNLDSLRENLVYRIDSYVCRKKFGGKIEEADVSQTVKDLKTYTVCP